MTQHLGIITAYGAVAILAWLVALLYPRLIPTSAIYEVERRWQQIGLLVLSTALAVGIAWLQGQDWKFDGDGPLAFSLNRLAIVSPILLFLASRRSRAAILVPDKHILRSLLIGVGFALIGLSAYFSSATTRVDPAVMMATVQPVPVVEIAVRTFLNCLVLAIFLTVLVGAWSVRTTLSIAALAIAATQVPSLLQGGFSTDWIGSLVVHVALVVGLLSAVLATRNIVWLWPVLAVLNLLQFSLA